MSAKNQFRLLTVSELRRLSGVQLEEYAELAARSLSIQDLPATGGDDVASYLGDSVAAKLREHVGESNTDTQQPKPQQDE